MTQIVAETTLFGTLASSVVVVTGGASGMGAAVTTLLRSHGAHVFFGDISVKSGHELQVSLASSIIQTSYRGSATFLQCDVSQYTDIYRLFRTAYDTHGRIDHAISCAGVLERGNFFTDPSMTIDTIATDTGDSSVLDINLTASINFARIANVFLRQPQSSPSTYQAIQHKSITFLSSIAALRDSPDMPLYQTSKVAILGLIRAMRTLNLSYSSSNTNTNQTNNIRVNAICPGMTFSTMTAHLIPHFEAAQKEHNQNPKTKMGHWQTSSQVADFIAHLMTDSSMHGKSVYVEEGKGWEFEDGLQKNTDSWLGEEPSRLLRENREFIRGLGGIRKD